MTILSVLPQARLNLRAFIFWGGAVTSLSVFALLEADAISTWAVALLLPFVPRPIGFRCRSFVIALAIALPSVGPYAVVLAIPLTFSALGLSRAAISGFLLLGAVAYLYPQAQSLPSVSFLTLPLASLLFLLLPAWGSALVFFNHIDRKGKVSLALVPLGIAVVIDLTAGNWVDTQLFTNPVFRLFIAFLPISIIFFSQISSKIVNEFETRSFFFSACVGALLIVFIPTSPIQNVTFDESHGKWETVLAPFGPEDFGRAANYTYSLLFERARRIVGESSAFMSEDDVLPPINSVFIVKMPSISFSQPFSARLSAWVEKGGRLIVIADHTDLYDSTQNINAFLRPLFGAAINTDAVYNSVGMLTIPTTDNAGILVARLDGHGRPLPWQTGASMKSLPAHAIELATFGASFAEPGDYSGPNRFGPFLPNLANRYYRHSAIIAFGHGNGAVSVVLDSTPWSNFSIFREQYVHLFRTLMDALSKPIQISILGYAGLVLGLLAVLSTFVPLRLIAPIGGALFGAALATSLTLSSTTLSMPIDSRDFGVRIVTGDRTRLEFLKQILLPGERNFSRIISSLGKYNLMPSASTPGSEIPRLTEAKRWLLIQPNPQQLPNYSETIAHLKRGGDLTILFAPEQATSQDVITWLSSFSFFTQRNIGLMISDSSKGAGGSLIGGRSVAIGREVRVTTSASHTSLLNGYENDPYLQTYTVRPTKMPRVSGLLSIGFSADQFTDDVVGEVWEGIYPSSIGKQREQLLAAVLTASERPQLMPERLLRPISIQAPQLPAYLVAENGTTKMSGTFSVGSLDDPVVSHFLRLRDQAHGFVLENCPQKDNLTQCESRMLADDMIEWMVSWRSTNDGNIVAIELLHERRLSGLGSTWNIVFGQ